LRCVGLATIIHLGVAYAYMHMHAQNGHLSVVTRTRTREGHHWSGKVSLIYEPYMASGARHSGAICKVLYEKVKSIVLLSNYNTSSIQLFHLRACPLVKVSAFQCRGYFRLPSSVYMSPLTYANPRMLQYLRSACWAAESRPNPFLPLTAIAIA